jgi:succinyl-CoA synthetase beta subunit
LLDPVRLTPYLIIRQPVLTTARLGFLEGKKMQVTGMLYGSKLLKFAGFPTAEVLGPGASEEEIKALIGRHGSVFIKPVFKGGIGKKGKSGLIGRASDLRTALKEKERLYFVEHRVGNTVAKANGVTFEGAVPAKHEVYFSITDSTDFRKPMMTLTHHGGMDIEELDASMIARIPFDPLTGLKSFSVSNALIELKAPKEIISPLVQQLPKLWDLFHNFGMTTLELNPIRMSPKGDRLVPVACDFKGGFDRDDLRWQRLNLPANLNAVDYSEFELEVNQLRTYQGQSDVCVINPNGTILAPTFGGGANSLVTQMLGDDAIISSDFGGNPPFEKMRDLAQICFRYWLKQSNVLFIIGGKSNNTDIYETLRAISDALRAHFSKYGPTPLFVVLGRGGPHLVRGMGAMRDTLEALGLPYRMFGFDSDISEVIAYSKRVDAWMKSGGRQQIESRLKIKHQASASGEQRVALVGA